jgi:RNA polymerase sigma-70 factor (ECF subfamily)
MANQGARSAPAGAYGPHSLNTTRSSLLSDIRDFTHESAWVEFDRLYRPLLIQYARHHGLGPGEAEEIAQQCVEVVLAQIADFQKRLSFRGWLRTIVLNKVRQFFRDQRRRAAGGDAMLEGVPDEAPPGDPWDREWEAAHLAYCLAEVRSTVAEHTYYAFELYVIRDMPVEEVSRILAMTPNQIYVAKNRVIKKLRERSDRLMQHLYGDAS